VLVKGYRKVLASLYAPSEFYERCYRSLQQWHSRKPQKASSIPLWPLMGIVFHSILHQGILSSYRKAYWKYLLRIIAHWSFDQAKFSMGVAMLLSGHHFIRYAQTVVANLDGELAKFPSSDLTADLSRETAAV
jgi:hypothetical protein